MSKKFIRDEIINAARRLFNQRGVPAVSMRDIAEKLSISVGNLTYHFPRKEDLIEAVVEENHRYRAPAIPVENLPQLNALFARMQNDIQQNAFYFWQHPPLPGLSPTVHEAQTALVKEQYDQLEKAFAKLQADGLLRPEAYRGEHRRLIRMVRLACMYWVPQTAQEAVLDHNQDFLDCIWSMLRPVLTPQGLEEYRNKVLKVRMEFE